MKKQTVQKKKNLLVEIAGDDVTDESSIDKNIIENNTPKYTLTSLMRLKLNELQCLAEENSIEINNSEKNRKKTKAELSKDLLGHFESA